MGIFDGKKEEDLPALKDWVLAELKQMVPEPEPALSKFYLASIRRFQKWSGPMAVRRGCPKGLTAVEVNTLVALHAMQLLEASNFRAWTRARNLNQFQRVTFQRALVLGAAFGMDGNYFSLPAESRRWAPFEEDAEDLFRGETPKRFGSNIRVDPMRIEQAVFHHLFPGAAAGYGDTMAGFAAIDSFCAPPDPDNPIVLSLRRALRKAMIRYNIQPTFEAQRWMMEWHPALLADLGARDLDGLEGEEMAQTEPDTTDDQFGPQKEADPALPQKWKGEVGGKIGIQVATLIKAGMEEGKITASCPKAPFHGMRGHPCVVWPAGLKNLAHHMRTVDADVIEKVFLEEGWVEVDDDGRPEISEVIFAARKGDGLVKRASANMAVLTSKGREALLPGAKIPDNPVLALPEEVQS